MDLYSETILDHYNHPRNTGKISKQTVRIVEHNPLCGDRIQLDILIDGKGRVKDLAFEGSGCAISQAALSLLSEEARGAAIKEMLAWQPQKVYDLLAVPISPARVRCALLGYVALQKALLLAQEKFRKHA